jgi:DNA repair protein RecO (recombination protein O)
VALDYVAEIADRMLPEHEPNDPYFRLILLVISEIEKGLDDIRAGEGDSFRMWRALTYFTLWSVRLGGWLPHLGVCIRSGEPLAAQETVYFHRGEDGLFSSRFRDADCRPMAPESREIAAEMLKKSLTALAEREWSRSTAADLRQFLEQRLEEQFEHRLKTAPLLAQL